MSAAWRIVIAGVIGAALVGCATSSTPRYQSPNQHALGAEANTTSQVATTPTANLPLEVKLDVGIDIFDPGIEKLDSDQKITTPSVRRAEAHYIPSLLAKTLDQRGVWGRVRVIPGKQTEMDVWIDGKILESDGVNLKVSVTVTDATGKPWYSRQYKEEVNRYIFDSDPTKQYRDPFQNLYEHIADDMLREAAKMNANVLREVRAVTQLQFAQRFAPDQFKGYLGTDPDGRTRVQSLPALDDPNIKRMVDLRARDLVFVDHIDEYFADFTREMQPAYDHWRQATHDEVQQMNSLKTQGLLRKIGGALAVLGGLAAMTATHSSGAGLAGLAGVAGGAYLFSTGMEKSEQVQIHEAALTELADSFGTGMKPHHINLSNRTITLTGTVEEQYAQWRGLLADIYQKENGLPSTAPLPIVTTDQNSTPTGH